MFGAYRIVLALMVALSHIGGAWGLESGRPRCHE